MRRIATISTISALAVLPFTAATAQAAPASDGLRGAVVSTHLPQRQPAAGAHGLAPQGLCDVFWIPGCGYIHF